MSLTINDPTGPAAELPIGSDDFRRFAESMYRTTAEEVSRWSYRRSSHRRSGKPRDKDC
jgi:hypothetical protein